MGENYSIGEFSKKTATTIRTLHYYDELGLLKPSYVSEKGRRYYTDKDFITLQRILALKFLGYSLEQIKEFFQKKTWDLMHSLSFQRNEMVQKKEQIENVIKALDRALHIVEDRNEIEPSVFITLINTIQMENEQKEWLKGYIDKDLVEEIYSLPENEQLELEKKWVELSTELKKLADLDHEDDRVQVLIGDMMSLVNDLTGDDLAFVQEISDKEVEDEIWLFHSPFTAEEEEWMANALDTYLKRKGVHLNNEDGTKES
ncbi:MerR family transcriptional regulator [Aquibacillus rhizosphaerae]|uniref:MerR family transcriptional regulator n=1 Tax=Aquibacillus rhizosphaerae TaxID=3051431 RepID=A0ABT7L2H2_9BACI|nr:MerR family transcriptional regulator [Aquibacillus sp. LR5S19]MDL4839407.1 MerR family transcriptional regulator [Aquibacillus sp. LR5S19]